MADHDRPPQGHRRHPRDGPARDSRRGHQPGDQPADHTGLDLDEDLTQALAGLPAKQKQAVAYHYLAGLPYTDVAVILGGSTDADAGPPQTASPPFGARIRAPRHGKEAAMSTQDLTRDLARAFADSDTHPSRLHDRLAAEAQRDGILDVAYRVVDSPVGPLLLAATGQGLIRVAYALEGHDAVLQALADRVSPRILQAPGRLDEVARELDEYFAGHRRAFDLPLDWRLWRASGAPC